MNEQKYIIQYPIPIECGLRCPYCFHQQLWQHNDRYPHDQYGARCAFTPEQYMAWRYKHLADGSEFLCELHGGEPSSCPDAVFEVMDALDKERFELQTNGLGPQSFYDGLIARKAKIARVGFTVHRAVIGVDRVRRGQFRDKVLQLKDAGVPVYVKELLFVDRKADILASKKLWEAVGVEFRLQDFKGHMGAYNDEASKYTAEDWALIHPEYCHGGEDCSCRAGYKQVLIRGYDIFGGDVLACWQDHKVVGSITEDWFNPDYSVRNDPTAPRGRSVAGGGEKYRSDYIRDINISQLEQKLYEKDKNHLNQTEDDMRTQAWVLNKIAELDATEQDAAAGAERCHVELERLAIVRQQSIGARVVLVELLDAERKANDAEAKTEAAGKTPPADAAHGDAVP